MSINIFVAVGTFKDPIITAFIMIEYATFLTHDQIIIRVDDFFADTDGKIDRVILFGGISITLSEEILGLLLLV